ncbi:maleate cis-trans isomerase family protein [Streptosporangium sp. CA-115845]|uniref:maleate cis-trans isomerase family protein n=1 Tax=Streptosporangium sp. CA-115845 TaxID=3240071 RepID=UPI003D9339BD
MSGTADRLAEAPARVGVVVPPGNPSAEPEITGLLPRSLITHTARLPVHDGVDLRTRLSRYNDDHTGTLASFGGLPLRAALLACTGSSYPLGPDGDARLCSDLSARHGFPVFTAASCVLAALTALGARSLVLVSPYPAWLTEQCAGFLREAGHQVNDVLPIPGSGAIYDLTGEDVRRVIDAVRPGQADAVLVAGTGAPSLAAMDAAAGKLSVPVLSSNLCGAWRLASSAGASGELRESPSPAMRRLTADAVLPQLAGTSRRGPSA